MQKNTGYTKNMEKHYSIYRVNPKYIKGKSVDNCWLAFRIKCELNGNFKSSIEERKEGEEAL